MSFPGATVLGRDADTGDFETIRWQCGHHQGTMHTEAKEVAGVIGVAWMLPGENLLASALADTGNYLPGQILTTLANGGGEPSYLTAPAVSALYAAMASAVGTAALATLTLATFGTSSRQHSGMR